MYIPQNFQLFISKDSINGCQYFVNLLKNVTQRSRNVLLVIVYV